MIPSNLSRLYNLSKWFNWTSWILERLHDGVFIPISWTEYLWFGSNDLLLVIPAKNGVFDYSKYRRLTFYTWFWWLMGWSLYIEFQINSMLRNPWNINLKTKLWILLRVTLYSRDALIKIIFPALHELFNLYIFNLYYIK